MLEVGAQGKDGGFGEAEHAAINSMLGQINSCLDHLEKNNHFHTRLQLLLESKPSRRPLGMPVPRLLEPPTSPNPASWLGSDLSTHHLA